MTAPLPAGPDPHLLDSALKRRAELRETIRSLVVALESATGPGHEGEWFARVIPCLDALRGDIDEHIETTEADGGLYDEIRTAQPRLSNQVSRLIADHKLLHQRIEDCCSLAARSAAAPDLECVKAVRDDATAIVALLQRHRQRGSDLIFEAYETDIGGGE